MRTAGVLRKQVIKLFELARWLQRRKSEPDGNANQAAKQKTDAFLATIAFRRDAKPESGLSAKQLFRALGRKNRIKNAVVGHPVGQPLRPVLDRGQLGTLALVETVPAFGEHVNLDGNFCGAI